MPSSAKAEAASAMSRAVEKRTLRVMKAPGTPDKEFGALGRKPLRITRTVRSLHERGASERAFNTEKGKAEHSTLRGASREVVVTRSSRLHELESRSQRG